MRRRGGWARFLFLGRVDVPADNVYLRGDVRSETGDHAGGARPWRVFLEQSAQRVEHDRAGDISVFGQSGPAVAGLVAIDVEELGQIVQDPRAAGVNDVEVEIAGIPAVVGGEPAQHRGERFHRPGYRAIQLEVEAGGADGVGDPVLGVRNEVRGIALQRHTRAAAAPYAGGGHRVAGQSVGRQRTDTVIVWLVTQ